MDRPFFFESPAPTPLQTTFVCPLSVCFLALVGYCSAVPLQLGADSDRARGVCVKEGYGGDDRGVGPSVVSTWIAQKQGLDPPTHPKRGTVRCGIAKKK